MFYITSRCNIGVKSEASRGKLESNNVQFFRVALIKSLFYLNTGGVVDPAVCI